MQKAAMMIMKSQPKRFVALGLRSQHPITTMAAMTKSTASQHRTHLGSHHHGLGEEEDEPCKDKEDKEEILHDDAATVALAFRPSSGSEMKRKEARDLSLASRTIEMEC